MPPQPTSYRKPEPATRNGRDWISGKRISVFATGEGRSLCFFEAAGRELVQQACN
jgi:hypothetical protein